MSTQKRKPIQLAERSLENTSEFGRAGKGVRLICTAFHKQLQAIKDSTQHRRLVSKLTQIIQTDPVHGRGQRTLADGDMSLLEGFDFCIQRQLLRLLHIQPIVQIDREGGLCKVYFPDFTPAYELSTEANITHIQLTAAAAELDFEKERFVTSSRSSELLSLQALATVDLDCEIPFDSPLPIVVVVGVRLLQVVNGAPYEMMQGGKIALQVVKAEKAIESLEDGKAGRPKVRKTKAGGKQRGTKTQTSGVGDLSGGTPLKKSAVSKKKAKPAIAKH